MNAQEYLESHWMRKKVWAHLQAPKHQERLRRCASYLKGRTFIDVGCGLGHSTSILKKFHPGVWAGLEFFEGAVVKAREIFPDISFISAEDYNLLFAIGGAVDGEGVFDGVVCSEVIEHVADAAALVRGLWAITGRTLVVSTPCTFVNDPGHLRLYKKADLELLFKDIPGARIERSSRFFYVIAERGER